MSQNKKITFEGVDNGVLDLMDKYRRKAEDTYGELLRDAQRLNSSSSEQLRLIQDRIRELEKENRLRAEAQRQELQSQFARLSAGATPERVRELRGQLSTGLSYVGRESSGESTLLSMVKDILVQMKKSDSESQKTKRQQLDKVNQDWDNKRALWEQEVREDPSGVKRAIHQGKANWFERGFMGRGDYSNASEYEKEKRQYQEGVLGQEGGSNKQESFFGALLKIEALKAILRSVTGVISSLSNAQSGDQLMNDMVGSIPFIGPMLSMPRKRMIDEQFNAQVPLNRLRGRTGQNNGMFSVEGAGFSIAETMPVADQVAIASGSGANNKSNTINSLLLERAFSLDRSTTQGMFSSSRMTGDTKTIVEQVATVMNLMPSLRNDRTQLNEILTLQNSLIQQQSQIVESVNTDAVTQAIATFRGFGGGFDDTRAMERISTINSSLMNPANDFQKARNFGVLSKLKPGSSYFELLESQEKGVYEKGFMGETMQQLEKEFGGGDAMMLAMKQRFGLSASATRTLYEGYKKNRGAFDNISGFSDLKSLGINLEGEASAMTSERERESAMISDAFVQGVTPGMRMAGKLMAGDFIEAINNAKLDIGPFNLKFGWAANLMKNLVPNDE